MDALSMEKAMLRNMFDKTGKDIDEWISIVKTTNFMKHNEIVNYLKSEFSLTHGYANLITRKTLNKK
tara:strand:- start:109 stop:309 length:201 start_codon:yes stop_codon:yes gene_type:complete